MLQRLLRKDRLNPIIVLEIALGATISILLAEMAGLKYASAAGITTLLTIQNSRDLTVKTTLQRYAAFALMLALSFVIMRPMGFTVISFGLFLLAFAGLCLLLDFQAVLASNAVLAAHFLSEGHMRLPIVGNAFWLLTIGAAVGVALNVLIPHQRRPLAHYRDRVEEALRDILRVMAGRILSPAAGEQAAQENTAVREAFSTLEDSIANYQAAAVAEGEDRFARRSTYPAAYFQMRSRQVMFLQRIWDNLERIENAYGMHDKLAGFFHATAGTFSERNNAVGLLAMHSNLEDLYRQAPLPATRQEFEDRALMYTVLMDIKSFLTIKRDFIAGVDVRELERYW